MLRLRAMALLFGAGLLGSFLAAPAKADPANKETIFTFSQPVEVSGRVLPAGKYVFEVMDSASGRNIVEIFNADQTRLYALVPAIPDYRLEPSGKTVVTFEERKAGSPEALKTWFYPGDQYGIEFLYPAKGPGGRNAGGAHS